MWLLFTHCIGKEDIRGQVIGQGGLRLNACFLDCWIHQSVPHLIVSINQSRICFQKRAIFAIRHFYDRYWDQIKLHDDMYLEDERSPLTKRKTPQNTNHLNQTKRLCSMNFRTATILLSASSLAAAQTQTVTTSTGGVCAGGVALTCSTRAGAFLDSQGTYADYMDGLEVLGDCTGPCLSGPKTADVCAKIKIICDGLGNKVCRGYPSQCIYTPEPIEPTCIASMEHVKDRSECDKCCNKQGCYVSYSDPNCPPGMICLGNACI